MRYVAFVDPSGGSADSFTLAIAHHTGDGGAVLDGAWEKKAPFDPSSVVGELAAIVKTYRIASVTGDRYGGEWPRESFRAFGIAYVPSEKTKSEIFLEFLVLANSGRARIPAIARLRQQLAGLERRTSRAGKDSVDHRPGAHDDLANAVAGALVLAASRSARKPFIPEVWEVRIGAPSAPAEFNDVQRGKDLNDPFLELPNDHWHKW